MDRAAAGAPAGKGHAMAAMNSNAGQLAPDAFKSFNLHSLDGKKKTLQDFATKLTMVTFFFPRCPYCNAELPEIQKIYDRYKQNGLSAVWINILPEETALVPGWLVAKKLTVPVLVGGSQDAFQRDYSIESTPTTYLLDANGKVLYRADGYKPGDEKVLDEKIGGFLGIPAATATSAALPFCPPAFGPALQ